MSKRKIRWVYVSYDGLRHHCYRDRYSGYYYMRCDGLAIVLPEDNALCALTCLVCATRSR
jgi:hypothetical protein